MPGLYDTYVKPALAGLQQAAGTVGQAFGLSAPDPGALEGLKRAAADPLQARIQSAYDTVSRQMPDVRAVSVSAGRGDEADPALMNTNLYTGNISYNPARVADKSDQELQELMAHELTHARQAQNTPWYQTAYRQLVGDNNAVPESMKGTKLDDPYYWTPIEQEAFQAQRDRMVASGRPAQRSPTTQRYDIYLPSERKR